MRVLVCHASAHGSTAEIAERIAARLRERKVVSRVDVSPAARARSAIEYDAVILGSAIHDRAWLPVARAFVVDNERALSSRPLWLFSVGVVDSLPYALRKRARTEGAKAIAALPATLDPRGTQLFSGVIRKDHLSSVGRALFRLLGCRYGDFRDWRAVDAWAEEIATDLAALERTVEHVEIDEPADAGFA